MKIQKQITIVCLLAALLAGCGGTNGQSEKNASPVIEQVSPPPTPSASSPAATTPSASSTPETDIEEKPLYRMNEVFRFVPIDDAAPKKAVLLTFDDGPKEEALITSILDTLDKHQAKAIFFVNGYRVKDNPDLLKLLHERGGTIGNHSYDHISLQNEETAVVEEQLSSVQTMVDELVSEKPKFFRPPYGEGGDAVKEIAKNHGMLYMTWSNGSMDWDPSAHNKPEVVIQSVMEQLHPGANILMHELQWTADALDELLGKIEAEGYTFIDPATIELTN